MTGVDRSGGPNGGAMFGRGCLSAIRCETYEACERDPYSTGREWMSDEYLYRVSFFAEAGMHVRRVVVDITLKYPNCDIDAVASGIKFFHKLGVDPSSLSSPSVKQVQQ